MTPDYMMWRTELSKVLDPRFYTLAWLDEQVKRGAFRVWTSDDAIILTSLKRYPTGALELHGMLAAGSMEEIVKVLIPQAEEWARSVGCIVAVIESREGWSRVLEQSGYHVFQVAIRKELS